jgi:hypothetical protein
MNSVSSLSQSTKEASKTSTGKRDGGPSIAKSSKKRMKSNPTFDSEARTNYAPDKEDKEADYVPITNKAVNNIMDGKTWEDDYGITKRHRKAFYLMAFPPIDPDKDFEKPQSKSASIPQCRPQTEVDYIKYVVENWQVGTEIRTMQEGPEKNALLHFRRNHKGGNKYVHQYTVDEIWAPGDLEPRTVLRRLEKNKDTQLVEAGRIILSREEVFDGINEWHYNNGHLGQERTWEYCKAKFGMSPKTMSGIIALHALHAFAKTQSPRSSRGPSSQFLSKNFQDRFQVDLIDFRRLRKRDPFGVLMRWIMKGCGCKKGKCGKNCGCKKKDMSCHSGCTCNGNCAN